MNEGSITHRYGDVCSGMRHPAASCHPTAPGHPTTVIQQPPVSQQSPVLSDTPAVSDTPTPKSQIKNRDRDLYECERESAFARAGDKRRALITA